MIRYLVLLLVVCAVRMPVAWAGPEPDKEDLDERFGRVTTAVEDAVAKNALLEKRLEQLSDELRTLREEQSKNSASSSATIQDELKKLAESIKEVDRKREADRQMVIEKLDALGRNVQEAIRASTTSSPSPSSTTMARGDTFTPTSPVSDKGYEYEVKPGDRLSAIVAAYNAKFREQKLKTVSLRQVQEANPGLNPHRLKAGQKIFIPMPSALE